MMYQAEDFSEWLRRQGHTVIRLNNISWFNQGHRVFQAFPYFQTISPGPAEVEAVFKETGAIALKYSTDVDQPVGKISYHVIRDEILEFDDLSKKVRHDILRGKAYAVYQKITFRQLAVEGWSIRYDTLLRQGRTAAETKEQWEKMCLVAEDLNGFEAWGALRGGQLIACVICSIVGDCCQILYHQSLTDHMKFGINNALAFSVTNEMLTRPDVHSIFYGLHSLDAPCSVDEFKFRMGFSAKAVRQRVVPNPLVAPFFNGFTYAGIKAARTIFPGNPFFAKAEGMFRFYLEGKRPLAEQDWPEVLIEQKKSILPQSNKP
jgi:hypothetical protein